MLSSADFLKSVEDLASTNPAYASGGDGTDGTCDCIGLIIGALRRCGVPWPGIHGSNWAIRHEVHDAQNISSSAALVPGAPVFKVHPPDESAWSLPARYAKDPDRNDYYHIGVVTSVNPLCITHCTVGGIKKDTALGKWTVTALLNAVEYENKGDDPSMNATVTSSDGNPVKLRPTASVSRSWLCRLSPGTSVTVLEKGETWSRIQYGDQVGWMMTQFLKFNEENGEDTVLLELPVNLARGLMDALENELGAN